MVVRIPELPHDKTYHLFVCYVTNALEVVRTIVDKLENEGVICCYYERDFTPGRSVVESMYEAIENSLYMMIVLSEDFENSRFCKDELDKASYLRAKGEYNLIPIIIEPCSVPECLQHLRYIDVQDTIDTADIKILDALSRKDMRLELREDKNGESVQFGLKTYKPSIFSFMRYKVKFTETERAEIWTNQFEVSADLLQEIEDTVNNSLYMKYLHIIDNACYIISIAFLHLLIVIMIVFLILLLNSGTEKTENLQPAGYCLAVGIPSWFLSFMVTWPVCSIRISRIQCTDCFKIWNVLNAALWNISEENIAQTGVIFFLKHHKFISPNYVKLHIMRYNFKPCEAYFARQLEKKEYLKTFCRENETNQEYTSRMFAEYLRHSCKYLDEASSTHRHRMKNNAKCVCLLVEGWLKTRKQ